MLLRNFTAPKLSKLVADETTKLSAAFIVKQNENCLIGSIAQSHYLQVHSGHLLFKFLENINKKI